MLTVPNGKLPYDVYDFEYDKWMSPQKATNAGEAFTVAPYYSQSPVLWQVFSENLTYPDAEPTAKLGYAEGGICVMAQSAAVAAELMTQAPSIPSTPVAVPVFTDVSPSSPYADAINRAVSAGITQGTSATTFSPDQGCTNAQILTFLWRRNGEPEPTIANPSPILSRTFTQRRRSGLMRRAWYLVRPLMRTSRVLAL